MVAVGERFTMKPDAEPFEVLSPDGKRRLANYLPGYGYTVTGKNLDVANKLIADGMAVAGGIAPSVPTGAAVQLGAGAGKVKGAVKVGAKK